MSARSASPPHDLWSSILDSVSSTRSIPSKSILVLGEERTGKSTIVRALLKKTEEESDGGDFALGYGWSDVRDDADEDTLARLSVYTVPSSAPSHLAIVPHYLPPRSLPHTLIMIVLDWTRPWSFISELEKWLRWVHQWAESDQSREAQMLKDEAKERLRLHLQNYSEPTPSDSPTSTSMSTAVLPLGPGQLTHNSAGVPIIVVCTKADLIDESQPDPGGPGKLGLGVGGKAKGGMWEERTDAVMQVLRTICLKYGAGLFYTTPSHQTLAVLRSYALHLLFVPTPVSPNDPLPRNPFPFPHRANTLDRDKIVVPVGWDSWGKINVVREGFDARRWGEGWESDLENQGTGGPAGAKEWFKEIVGGENGSQAAPTPPMVQPKPEQTFLAGHFETLQKDRDPRATFRQPAAAGPNAAAGAAGGLPRIAPEAGVVGPMGSSSFHMPSVEKAMLELQVDESRRPSLAVPKETRTQPTPLSTSHTAHPTLSSLPSARAIVSPTTSPSEAPRSTTSPTGVTTQHEVLQNFFQSLLGPKGKEGSSTTTATARTVSQPKVPAEGVNGASEGSK